LLSNFKDNYNAFIKTATLTLCEVAYKICVKFILVIEQNSYKIKQSTPQVLGTIF